MFKLQLSLGLLSLITLARAAPLASIHVKFISPPHVYEHGITTDGGNTIMQTSFLSIGRNNRAKNSRRFEETDSEQTQPRIISQSNVESFRPIGQVFFSPIDMNDFNYNREDYQRVTPDFSNGLDYPDPYLLTGEQAVLAVKYLYGRGELFYEDYPHIRALLRNQEERRRNGLRPLALSSLRPGSPFARKV